MQEIEKLQQQYNVGINTVDNVLNKSYLSGLSELEVATIDGDLPPVTKTSRFFKITQLVYEKDEVITEKFTSLLNTLAGSSDVAIVIIIRSVGTKIDFYMGINNNTSNDTGALHKRLMQSVCGQFPGTQVTPLRDPELEEVVGDITSENVSNIAAVSVIPGQRDSDQQNKAFVQGIEKFVLTMRGKEYTATLIANGTSNVQLENIRKNYENLATSLAPFASGTYIQGLSHSDMNSVSDGQTKGTSKARGVSYSTNSSTTNTFGGSVGGGFGKGSGSSTGVSKTVGANASAGGELGKAAVGAVGVNVARTVTSAITESLNASINFQANYSHASQHGESHGNTITDTTTESSTHQDTKGTTDTRSDSFQRSTKNYYVADIIKKIEDQIKRVQSFENQAMWLTGAYFTSTKQANATIAANTFWSLMRGKNSGIEMNGVNSWNLNRDENDVRYNVAKFTELQKYIGNFIHPIFVKPVPEDEDGQNGIFVNSAVMISGSELALLFGFPRKSVPGLPVIDHASFGYEVNKHDGSSISLETSIGLGNVYRYGDGKQKNKRSQEPEVRLDMQSLAAHTFITGSTNTGKSNTVYHMLQQLKDKGIKFMVVEPVKGEYKNVFGNDTDVAVYGTNPQYTNLLRINPFAFPEKIHVLEHVDRLVEIFNVCWPMYAAMPAILKDAILKAYEECGWNLMTSKNEKRIFPTFIDLEETLSDVVNSSAYSADTKGDYTGALVTRIHSLTTGLNSLIFTNKPISDAALFDENTIVDLSRVGSSETKSLIMGLVVMKLNEFRSNDSDGLMNQPLQHVTVLEEAHHLLKHTSTEQTQDGANLVGKSVEMLSNSIAEMRTYGEGFIIVDQSPTSVDIAAIKNTNTKIVMRTPEINDRQLVGKSIGLQDKQIEEISKFGKGVAAVYQNDWLEAVLCYIDKPDIHESKYEYNGDENVDTTQHRLVILGFLLSQNLDNDFNIDEVKDAIDRVEMSSKLRQQLINLITEYENDRYLAIWNFDEYSQLAGYVTQITDLASASCKLINSSQSMSAMYDGLHDIIQTRLATTDEELTREIEQALMRTLSTNYDSAVELYQAWVEEDRLRGDLL